MANETKEGWAEHAATLATFYKALVDQGVPETTATGLVQELNHQSLRARFRQ